MTDAVLMAAIEASDVVVSAAWERHRALIVEARRRAGSADRGIGRWLFDRENRRKG